MIVKLAQLAVPLILPGQRSSESMDSFCAELSGEVLAACMAIPERCVALKAPPFVQVIGEPHLFLRIQQVVQEASAYIKMMV